jgi:hypothetical protein
VGRPAEHVLPGPAPQRLSAFMDSGRARRWARAGNSHNQDDSVF